MYVLFDFFQLNNYLQTFKTGYSKLMEDTHFKKLIYLLFFIARKLNIYNKLCNIVCCLLTDCYKNGHISIYCVKNVLLPISIL